MENLTNEEQKMFFDSLAEVDYEFYAEYVNPEYVHGQHTKYVCNLLSDIVENDRGGKYIITMPPQHSKSYTITETFPSFYLGNFPTRSVITVGYSGNFAEKFGRKNLNKIREYGSDVFGVQTGEKETYKDWTLEHGGRMLSSGIGGQITGERADCLLIDDPVKNRQDANNKRYRDRLWDEWENTLSTRLAENSLVILIQTLWHEDGLAGRLMEREAEKWNVLKFPALSPGKEQDILGREKDEPLWPFQYSKEYLEERRRDLDSKTWNSLYMCAPNIEQGNQFKSIYFRYFRENDDKSAFILEDNEKRVILKSRCVPFQTVDSSFKKKNRHDPTVISTWYLTPNNDILLYNVYKDRISVPDLFPTLESLMDRYKPVKVFVEDKASGTGIIQTAKRKGRPVIAVPSQNDKVTKSFEISSFYENRAVYHKQDTEWVADYEDELTKFPETAHDDQVDTASIAGMVVSRNFLRAGESSGGFVTSI